MTKAVDAAATRPRHAYPAGPVLELRAGEHVRRPDAPPRNGQTAQCSRACRPANMSGSRRYRAVAKLWADEHVRRLDAPALWVSELRVGKHVRRLDAPRAR